MQTIWLVNKAGRCYQLLCKPFLLVQSIILYGLLASISLFIGISLTSCSNSELLGDETPMLVIDSSPSIPPIVPSPVDKQTSKSNSEISVDFNFPSNIDPTQRYLFYLHGKIIEDQGVPAISPEYGEYSYEEILRALKNYGFVVISEQRPKDTNVEEYALRVTKQVNELLNAEVHPGSVTVVGASKGAAIVALVSNLLGNREVNYVFLGGCYPTLIDEWKQQGVSLFGNVLSIFDSSDRYAISCRELFVISGDNKLSRHDEIVLHVGTGHGILYEPLMDWIMPTVQWAKQEW